MSSVFDFAKYFINKNLDNPRNTMQGNMKLQKLLAFSYIVHYVTKNKMLFTDCKLYAYKNGCVCEPVRLKYRNDFQNFMEESRKFIPNFTNEEQDTLTFVENKLGNKTAEELSSINHTFDFWKNSFENSKTIGIPIKSKSVISNEDIMNEKERILEVLNEIDNLQYIEVNNLKFYYDPNEIKITDDLIRELSSFVPIDNEDTYTIYYDAGAGLVIY